LVTTSVVVVEGAGFGLAIIVDVIGISRVEVVTTNPSFEEVIGVTTVSDRLVRVMFMDGVAAVEEAEAELLSEIVVVSEPTAEVIAVNPTGIDEVIGVLTVSDRLTGVILKDVVGTVEEAEAELVVNVVVIGISRTELAAIDPILLDKVKGVVSV